MKRKNSLGVFRKTHSLIKLALGVLIAGTLSLECKAGWTQFASTYSSVTATNDGASPQTANSTDNEISLTATNGGNINGLERTLWETASWFIADVYADESGVSASVSDSGTASSIMAFGATIPSYMQGAIFGGNGSSTYQWDGPPSGPQGTSAESPCIHISLDLLGDADEGGNVVAGTNTESAFCSCGSGTSVTVGILSSGGADDFYYSASASVSGSGDTSPTAESSYSLDAPDAVDTFTDQTNYTTYPAPGPGESDQSAASYYHASLEEDTVLDQGSTEFTAIIDISNFCSARISMTSDGVHNSDELGSWAAAVFTGSASVTVSGIILH